MGWLLKENAFWAVLSFALGAIATWFLVARRVTVREAVGVGVPRVDSLDLDRPRTDLPRAKSPDLDMKVPPMTAPDMDVPAAAAAGYGAHRAETSEAEEEATVEADGAAPHSRFTIKGNADSMLYHSPESPYYGRTKAEVWFDTEERAQAAGFTRWDER